MLDDALFTSRMEAWAVGANGPVAGTEGMGERILLHTADGGRTWIEVPRTRWYALPSSVAFLDPKTGWIRTYKSQFADELLLKTSDGGRTWRDVIGKFPGLPNVVDVNHWWGVASKPLMNSPDGRHWARTFFSTNDAGRTWNKSPIPDEAGDFPVVHFHSIDIGWAGTVTGDDFIIFRTTDGGKTWEKSLTTPPTHPAELRDLFFLDPNHGWAIVTYPLKQGVRPEGSYVYSTTDGGKTWVRNESEVFQNDFTWWISLLSDRFGIAGLDGGIAYSVDAGVHWKKVEMPGFVMGCQAFQGDFFCSARTPKSQLSVLTIHPR